jgi:hypothetical protein
MIGSTEETRCPLVYPVGQYDDKYVDADYSHHTLLLALESVGLLGAAICGIALAFIRHFLIR